VIGTEVTIRVTADKLLLIWSSGWQHRGKLTARGIVWRATSRRAAKLPRTLYRTKAAG